MERFSVVKVLRVSADRLWSALKDIPYILSQIMPMSRVSVEIIAGDGGSGSVRVFRMPLGMGMVENAPIVDYAVARLDLVDEESMTEVHSVIGGEMMAKFYSFYRCTKIFSPYNDGKSCIVTWTVEYIPLMPVKLEVRRKSVEVVLLWLEHYLMESNDYYPAIQKLDCSFSFSRQPPSQTGCNASSTLRMVEHDR